MTRPMNSVLRPYARAMNPRRSLLILVGAVAAFVVTQLFMGAILGDLTPKLLELETTFSDDRFTGILSGLSDAEITALRQSIQFDFVYALLYGFVLWWGVRMVNGPRNSTRAAIGCGRRHPSSRRPSTTSRTSHTST